MEKEQMQDVSIETLVQRNKLLKNLMKVNTGLFVLALAGIVWLVHQFALQENQELWAIIMFPCALVNACAIQ